MEKVCSFFGHRKIEKTPELRERLINTVSWLISEQGVSKFLFGDKSDFDDFCQTTADALGLNPEELTTVCSNGRAKRVALVSGCGKDEIKAVVAAGADTFVTGEVMHNHMIECKEMGLNLICGTHYATERIIVPVLADIVREYVKADVFEFVREHEYGI